MLCHFIFCVYGCSFWILKEHEGFQETGCLKSEGTAVLFQCHVFFFFFFFQNFHSHSFCILHTPHQHPEPLIYQSPADSPSPFVQPANNNSNNKKHPQEDLYIYLALWESQCKYLLTTTVFFFFFSVSALKYRRDGGFLFYMLSSMASKDPKS